MNKSSLNKNKYDYKCSKGSTKDFPNLLIYKKSKDANSKK